MVKMPKLWKSMFYLAENKYVSKGYKWIAIIAVLTKFIDRITNSCESFLPQVQ